MVELMLIEAPGKKRIGPMMVNSVAQKEATIKAGAGPRRVFQEETSFLLRALGRGRGRGVLKGNGTLCCPCPVTD